MIRLLIVAALVATWIALQPHGCFAVDPLKVVSDFEGASVRAIDTDQAARSISFSPGGDPARGWPCWWYFRIDGITPERDDHVAIAGLDGNAREAEAAVGFLGDARSSNLFDRWRDLAAHRGRPDAGRVDDLHAQAGCRSRSFVAWGPPYTPSTAAQIRERNEQEISSCDRRGVVSIARRSPRADAASRGRRADRQSNASVSGFRLGSMPGKVVPVGWRKDSLGGCSSDDPDAAWLRQHAEVFIIPIMDVDNTATGNGGKNALPHDHNRDWSSEPHWNETVAAQRMVGSLIAEGRMDVFLDLHNPAPGDPSFFYILPHEMLQGADDRLCATGSSNWHTGESARSSR